MPLVDLGLISRLEADDPALTTPAEAPSRRAVRCVAGFYGESDDAEDVADALREQFGLGNDQVELIFPDGLTRVTFDRVAQRWQCLRPRWGRLGQGLQLLIGAATGMLTGGLAALVGWSLLGDSGHWADARAWLLPGLWAGALAGAVTTVVVSWRHSRHRFDVTVARKLRRGYSVVVAHGLGERQQAPVLAYLQDTSHSWCAEAPHRDKRL